MVYSKNTDLSIVTMLMLNQFLCQEFSVKPIESYTHLSIDKLKNEFNNFQIIEKKGLKSKVLTAFLFVKADEGVNMDIK